MQTWSLWYLNSPLLETFLLLSARDLHQNLWRRTKENQGRSSRVQKHWIQLHLKEMSRQSTFLVHSSNFLWMTATIIDKLKKDEWNLWHTQSNYSAGGAPLVPNNLCNKYSIRCSQMVNNSFVRCNSQGSSKTPATDCSFKESWFEFVVSQNYLMACVKVRSLRGLLNEEPTHSQSFVFFLVHKCKMEMGSVVT